jgi:hypothetical protein
LHFLLYRTDTPDIHGIAAFATDEMPEHEFIIVEFLEDVFFSGFCGTEQFGFPGYPDFEVPGLGKIVKERINPCLWNKDFNKKENW